MPAGDPLAEALAEALAADPDGAPGPEGPRYGNPDDLTSALADALATEFDAEGRTAAAAAADAASAEEAVNAPLDAIAAGSAPLSAAEREGFRLAVEQCWNLGPLSGEAREASVTVGLTMARDGTPMQDSIRLIAGSGAPDAAITQAFEAARRAIIRCTGNGYPLPGYKYESWREIVIDFRPEGAVLRRSAP